MPTFEKSEHRALKRLGDLHIGDTIFVRNADMRGSTVSDEIERKRWEPHVIHGETRVSWLYGLQNRPSKLPKKGPVPPDIAFSPDEVEQRVWIWRHKRKIADVLSRREFDYETLRAIARLVNYDDETQT